MPLFILFNSNIMKKIILYSLVILGFVPAWSDDGLQLFGSRRDAEKDKSNNQSSFSQNSDEKQDFTSSEVSSRKNIESVIPVKRIPGGWVFRDELLAPWESNLPAVLSIIPDTTVEVVYHDDDRTTRGGESLMALQNRSASWGRTVLVNCYGDGGNISSASALKILQNKDRLERSKVDPLQFEGVSSDPRNKRLQIGY